MRIRAFERWSMVFTVGAFVWTVAAGVVIWMTPVRYAYYSSNGAEPRFDYVPFSEASGLGAWLLVPATVLAAIAAIPAWRRQTLALGALTFLLFGYCVMTGFSFGLAYVPAAAALLAATVISQSEKRPGYQAM